MTLPPRSLLFVNALVQDRNPFHLLGPRSNQGSLYRMALRAADLRSTLLALHLKVSHSDLVVNHETLTCSLSVKGPQVPMSPGRKQWYDKLADALLGDDEMSMNAAGNKYALICQKCFTHNGLVKEEVWEDARKPASCRMPLFL